MAFSMIACGGTDQEADEQQNQEQVSEEKTGIAAVVDNLYHSNYEYEKTQTTMLGDEEVQVVYQGAYIASPYQEHVKVIEAPDEADWTEAYSSGDGETVESTFRTADGLMTQESERSYPYGYGENLEFTWIGRRRWTEFSVMCIGRSIPARFRMDPGRWMPLSSRSIILTEKSSRWQ